MKNLPKNLLLRGRLILLKVIVFLFLISYSISCAESITSEDAKKIIQELKKENGDPEHPGPLPPLPNPIPKPDSCLQK